MYCSMPQRSMKRLLCMHSKKGIPICSSEQASLLGHTYAWVQGCRKATPQKRARQGQLTFRSSQEEKRGALPLSLSQSTDAKAASKKQSQSTLQFQPISRDEAAALSCSQAEMPTDRQDASKGSFRGFGSGSQEQKAPEQSGRHDKACNRPWNPCNCYHYSFKACSLE